MTDKQKTMTTKPQIKKRNPVATSPLLKKGGAHEKSKSAKRQQLNRELKKSLNDE